tara:strand:- start:10524 stop:13127 length:2604 start_codon:yes stop_codon:yes gene_type:complete
MPAITQRIDNYLGGVSRQSDDKKLPGQVTECLNGYPDPTFGLTKRPGLKWIANLGTGTTYDNAKWFYIARTADEKYIGCIKPKPNSGFGDIDIWNIDGTACTVNMDTSTSTNAVNYLTGARVNYEVLTVQDTSIITNNLHTVAAQAAPTFNANRKATIVLSGSPLSNEYKVILNGTTITHTSNTGSSYVSILAAFKTAIDNLGVSGLTTTQYLESLHLTDSNSTITIEASGGDSGSSMRVFQDQVDNVSQLPLESFDGHTVKVQNTSSTNDTYFAKFEADNGTSGPGYWGETRDPTVSAGLDSATMPHELVNTSLNNFTFRQATWIDRIVGDDKTNSHPSFVGSKIEQSFFYNNRLGFLSQDNVSMSQSQDFYNFYHTSAQIVTDADPVDVSCSTIRPAALHAVLPTVQGLILFSKNQQFLLSAADGVLTPSTANVRTISNYEMSTDVDPVDIGTNIHFIAKTPSYTRTFYMLTKGQDESPTVLDIGRVVNEWVPATIDTLIASPQNQFLAMSSQSSRYIYFFRTYHDGKELLVESWFNWKTCGTVQAIASDSDELYTVTKQGSQFTLSQASMSQSPSDAIIVNNDGTSINPCMDLYATATSVVWDSTNEFSKCYIPWNNVTGLKPVLVIKGTAASGALVESGFSTNPTVATDGNGTYFKVPKKNLTSVASDVIVGWRYDLDVILPKTYFRSDDEQKITDYTANLTINRMKFAVGLSGGLGFKLKSTGVRQGSKTYTGDGSTTVFSWIEDDISYTDSDQIKVKVDGAEVTAFTVSGDTQITFNTAPINGAEIVIYLDEWYNIESTTIADTYLANDVALSSSNIFSIPIHQRTDNFQLRIFNDSPFPVSLNSMMWEGHYSPRFYRRKF